MVSPDLSTQRKLLSVNNYYYPRGGADAVFLDHNEMFVSAGWLVAPFAMQHPSNRETPWSDSFVTEIEFGSDYSTWEMLSKATRAVYSFEARRKIADLISRLKPDVCHAHNVYHHLSPSILPVIRKAGIPLVMTLHDLKLACPAYSMLTHDGVCERCRGGRLYNVVKHRCLKGSLALSGLIMFESYLHRFLRSYEGNVDRFIVPSKFYKNKFIEWGFDPAKFQYIPNYVDAEHLRPDFHPGMRFLFFGRLSVEKGLITLVKAAAAAGVPLDIAGRGPQESALRALAEETGADVRFLGFLQGEDLHVAIRGCRAVVLPSEWYENAPLSLLEAYAHGKCVVASSMGGLPEMVLPQRTGLTYPGGSVVELTEILKDLAACPDSQLAAMGEQARQLVMERFSPQHYFARVVELYDSLTR